MVRFVEEPVRSSYAARNRGLLEARGDVLAFVDADMTVPPDFLIRVLEHMERTGHQYVGWEVDIEMAEVTVAGLYSKLTDLQIASHIRDHFFVATCSLTVRATCLSGVLASRTNSPAAPPPRTPSGARSTQS